MPAPTFTRPIQGSAPNQFVQTALDEAAINDALEQLYTAIAAGADTATINDIISRIEGVQSLEDDVAAAMALLQAQIAGGPVASIEGGSTPKLFFRRGATTAIVVTRDATDKEYLLYQIGQTSDSVPAASVGGDFEMMRSQQVWRCDQAVLYRKDYDSSTGTVGALGTNLDPFFGTFSSPTRINQDNSGAVSMRAHNLDPGASITYVFSGRRFSLNATKMNLCYYATTGASQDVDIAVNGTVVKTFSARADSAGNSVVIVDFDVPLRTPTGDITITLTNNDLDWQFYPIGLNMTELRDCKPEFGYDAFTVWYRTADGYISTNGANDYAYRDESTLLFAGSYHGGETSNYLRFDIGGQRYDTTSLPVLGWGVAHHVGIAQETSINGQYTTRSSYSYSVDGVEHFRCQFFGSNECRTFYTMMCAADDGFSYIINPGNAALPAIETTQALDSDVTDVVQYNPATTQFIRSVWTRFERTNNAFNGPHIWNRVGTYRKIYDGPAVNSAKVVTNPSFERYREFGFAKY